MENALHLNLVQFISGDTMNVAMIYFSSSKLHNFVIFCTLKAGLFKKIEFRTLIRD